MIEKEKIIQIDGNKALTNKGRIFERLVEVGKGQTWWEVPLPGELHDPEPEDN